VLRLRKGSPPHGGQKRWASSSLIDVTSSRGHWMCSAANPPPSFVSVNFQKNRNRESPARSSRRRGTWRRRPSTAIKRLASKVCIEGWGQSFRGVSRLNARSPVCTFTRPPLRCRSCALRLGVQNSRFRALRVLDSSPLAGSGSPSKNFLTWQRGYAATWEKRTFESVTELPFKQA